MSVAVSARGWLARSWLSANALCLVGLLLAAPASAQVSEPAPADAARGPLQIRYSAELSCPTAAEFEARVLERTSRANSQESLPVMRVNIERTLEGFIARLQFSSAGGEVSREVAGEDCDEVASAIALVAALAVDAHVRAKRREPAPVKPTPQAEAPEPERDPKPQPEPARSWKLTWGLAVSGALDVGPAPEALLGGGAMVALGVDDWSHMLRLGVGYRRRRLSHRDTPQSELLEYEVALLVARAELCPQQLELGASVSLYPCVALEGGQYSATRGAGAFASASTPADNRQAWGSLFAALRLDLRPAEQMSVELAPQLSVPFNTETAIVVQDPNTNLQKSLHDVGNIGFLFSGGVRFNFR